MTCTKHTVIDFLRSYEMDYLDVDFDINLAIFLDQMTRGLAGEQSSLEMIPTFLSADSEVPEDKPVIVGDAGGTNFRVATVCFDANDNAVIENLEKTTMPGVERRLSDQEFFEAMAERFRPVLSVSDKIGFCFSFPVQVMPNKDGKLIRFAKEIKAEEVVGELIGKNLLQTLGVESEKGIVLLNDTVATLLAGVGYKKRTFSSYIGFILGTGTNTCYIEKNSNILKQKELSSESSMIINTESGGIVGIHRGELDLELDQTTNNPGVHAFEKTISGAYLGSLALLTMKAAAADGLLSEHTANAIQNMDDLDTKDVNDFMFYAYGDNPLAKACSNGNPQDRQFIYIIAERLVERAAKLAAINLSAMAIKSQQGTDPVRPICIVAEGTTFCHMKNLRDGVEFYLKQHLTNERGIYTEIVTVENATLIGAAKAGLIN
ncbi:MAG: hexokinase family protein [Planctomycetota bacterium]